MNRHDALLGALVADAASLGLHWLYDQDHIKLIESTGSLLFRQPDAAHYKDKRGYFATSIGGQVNQRTMVNRHASLESLL